MCWPRWMRIGDGVLAETELVLDTAVKQAAIAARLTALDLPNPRIVGDVQSYTISHDVANGEWVTRECTTCHSDASPLVQPFTLAAARPNRRNADPVVQRWHAVARRV